MQLVQYFSDGTIFFNWDQLPDNIKVRTDIRDKIFEELQKKVKLGSNITSRDLLELNIYAIKRIKSELK